MLGLLAGGAMTVSAQTPKVVVGILVDQLRTDYLEQLRPYFGTDGFNRLIQEGVYIQDVDFKGSVSDAPSGAAVVYTGAWPSANGMAGKEVLDPVQKRNVPALASDPSKTRIEYTPENLRLSTIADEYVINNGVMTRVYSVAGDPQVAVVTAGHAGTSAIWLDETVAKWATPTYYGTLPPTIGNKNRTYPPSSKIASTSWRPLHPASFYGTDKTWSDGDFIYGFSGGTRDTYNRFKESAPFNTEVTDVAIDLLKSLQTGSTAPGMVNLAYTVAPIGFDLDGDNRAELYDSYVRLDAEISRLLQAIDGSYGKGNALVFLSSTGYADEPEIPEAMARIPSGEITLKKIESLLNSYLSAKYGNGDYVTLIRDGKVYLDHSLAEKKGVEIRNLREEAKAFLLKMGGIGETFTVDEVVRADSPRMQNISLGIDPKNAADLFLFFTPGWTVTDDNVYPAVSEKVRLVSPPTPAFIISPGIAPEIITTTVDATAIAPTVSSLLRIRAPNGAATKPISLKAGV